MRVIQSLGTLVVLCLFAASARAITLSGRISDIFGNGVSPATIEVRDTRTLALLATPGNTTAANGNYAIDLPAGRYDIAIVPAVASRALGDSRNGVRVDAPTVLNFQLPPGALLSGRLVDPAGAGIPHVDLRFESPGVGVPPAGVLNAVTDELGVVNALVSPGTWLVSALPRADQHFAPRRLGTFTLTTDQTLGVQRLEPGFLVTGRIRDPLGAPLAAAEWYAVDPASREEQFTWPDQTDGNGLASFRLAAGTYDFVAVPPPGPVFASRTVRRVVVAADVTLPEQALLPGVGLLARCVDGTGAAAAGVECRLDSLPGGQPLGASHALTDADGSVFVIGVPGRFSVTFTPPFASRLLPVRFDSLEIGGDRDFGTLAHASGHVLSVTVLDATTGRPIPGANVDLVEEATGRVLYTPGDVTDASGLARFLCDTRAYRMLVHSPAPTWGDALVPGLRTLADSALVVRLADPALAVGDAVRPGAPALELSAPRPNPARAGQALDLAFALRHEGRVHVDLLDAFGRRVRHEDLGVLPGGPARRRWMSTGLAPGRYLVRIRNAAGEQAVRSWVLLR